MDFFMLKPVCFFVLVSSVWKVILCQSEKCFREYETESTYRNENVVYVCTNTTTPEYTDTVYMDTARIARFDTSTCACFVTFAGNGTHSVRIDFKYENSEMHTLLVEGFSTNFSTRDESRNIDVATQENMLKFTTNSTTINPINACLRLSLRGSGDVKSLFKASCFVTGYEVLTTPSMPSISQTTNNPTETSTKVDSTSTSQGTSSVTDEDSTDQTQHEDDSGLVIGAAVGGTLGLVIIILVIIIVILLNKRKGRPDDKEVSYYNAGADNGTYLTPNHEQINNSYDEIHPDNKPDDAKYQNDASVAASNVGTDVRGIKTDKAKKQKREPNTADYYNVTSQTGARGAEYSSLDHRVGITHGNDHVYNDLAENDREKHGAYYNTTD